MLVFLNNVTCVVLLYQFPFEFIKGYLRRYMQRLIGRVLSSFGQIDLDQRIQRQKLCLYAKNTFFSKKSIFCIYAWFLTLNPLVQVTLSKTG